MAKVGRNDPCLCGSGKKFKQCHGAADTRSAAAAPVGKSGALQLVVSGMQLQQAQRPDEAEAMYRKALAIDAREPDALHLLGLLYHQRGNHAAGVDLIEKAISARPGVAIYYNNLGEIFRKTERYDDAIVQYDKAIKIQPEFVEPRINRGVALRKLRRFEESEQSYRAALKLAPAMRQIRLNLGHVLRDQDRKAEATVEYRHALDMHGEDVATLNDLGGALGEMGETGEAIVLLEKALALDPGNVDVINNIGTAWERAGDLTRALACYREVVALKPDFVVGHQNIGIALYKKGDLPAAIEALDHAISLEPDNGDVHYALSDALFQAGQLTRAWEERTWRFRCKNDPREQRPFPQPVWQGEAIEGKSIVVWGEQGVGDELWMAGMFPELLERLGPAGKLIFECKPKIHPLLALSFPQVEFIERQYPPHRDALATDLQIAGGDLGRYLRASIEMFPARRSYLRPDPERAAYWKQRVAALGPGLKIGICWRSSLVHGSRAGFSTQLLEWEEVLRVAGVQFVNLQYDECQLELAEAKRTLGVNIEHFDEVDMFNDLAETAALMCGLDLAISAPTAVSIMTGALGVPTWQTALYGNWQRMGLQDRNPWYPTVSTYTRGAGQDWGMVLHKVASDLQARVSDPAQISVNTDSAPA
jgi:tetratricopeptide (TPR) repeat protein